MTSEQVKEIQSAVATTHWRMDFDEFCKRTGWVGEYAKEKWHDWRKLNDALAKFDPATLAKIIG